MKAQALTCLQLAYKLPLKEPLARDQDYILKRAVGLALESKGNQWDAAALFMLTYADQLLNLPTLTADDKGVVAKATGMTLGLTRHMKRPDAIKPMVLEMLERYRAHPDHGLR